MPIRTASERGSARRSRVHAHGTRCGRGPRAARGGAERCRSGLDARATGEGSPSPVLPAVPPVRPARAPTAAERPRAAAGSGAARAWRARLLRVPSRPRGAPRCTTPTPHFLQRATLVREGRRGPGTRLRTGSTCRLGIPWGSGCGCAHPFPPAGGSEGERSGWRDWAVPPHRSPRRRASHDDRAPGHPARPPGRRTPQPAAPRRLELVRAAPRRPGPHPAQRRCSAPA